MRIFTKIIMLCVFISVNAMACGGKAQASSLDIEVGNRTLSIIKPDATKRNITGKVNTIIESSGLKIVAQKRIQLTKAQAGAFYAVHNERPFFNRLVEFMISAPVVVQVLEGDDAVKKYRKIMGATNPADAAAGTIRKELALSMQENTVHGSDSDVNAANEIKFFFADTEIVR
jgi:nucleoside-diphosphate kinase